MLIKKGIASGYTTTAHNINKVCRDCKGTIYPLQSPKLGLLANPWCYRHGLKITTFDQEVVIDIWSGGYLDSRTMVRILVSNHNNQVLKAEALQSDSIDWRNNLTEYLKNIL